MAAYAAAMQKPLVITGLTQQSLPLLQAVFPEQFTLENDRDSADYLYRTADFVALSGKKYHKKRNHIAQFAKYAPVFSEMTPDDFAECIAFAAESYNAKDGYTDASSVAEQYAIHTFFENFSALELKGGVLRVDGRLAAFSIGEPICSNVFGVHIEKADTRYHGAYPAMAREFAALLCHGLHLSESGGRSGHCRTAEIEAVLLSGTAAGKMDGNLSYAGGTVLKAVSPKF